MNAITLHDLKNKKAFDLHELETLIENDQILSATYYACDFSSTVDDFDLSKKKSKSSDNVFILFFKYRGNLEEDDNSPPKEGYLSQVNTILPKTFKTPQAVMSNAYKLDLKKYLVDATYWTASHFNLYKKQVEIARDKANS